MCRVLIDQHQTDRTLRDDERAVQLPDHAQRRQRTGRGHRFERW